MVLHHLRSVVIAVRGTETPEDLITDGLCGECSLSVEDLDGLIKQVSLPFCVCVYHHLSMSLFSPISVLYACSFKLQHFLCFPKAVFINIGNTNLTIFMSFLHISAALSFFFLISKAIVLKVPKVYMMHTRSKKGRIDKKQHSR